MKLIKDNELKFFPPNTASSHAKEELQKYMPKVNKALVGAAFGKEIVAVLKKFLKDVDTHVTLEKIESGLVFDTEFVSLREANFQLKDLVLVVQTALNILNEGRSSETRGNPDVRRADDLVDAKYMTIVHDTANQCLVVVLDWTKVDDVTTSVQNTIAEWIREGRKAMVNESRPGLVKV